MDCKITCFERVIHIVNPLLPEKIKDGVDIVREYSFQDLLDFGVENGCFSKEQASTLYDGIVMWEDLDGTYWEKDHEKYTKLLDAMGITDMAFKNNPKYDWSEFSRKSFNALKNTTINGTQNTEDILGSVRAGELCIEIVTEPTSNQREKFILAFDIYVGGVDTGYSLNSDYPYDFINGGVLPNTFTQMTYETFKNTAERLFSEYILHENNHYEYADLIDKANAPLKIW